MLKSRPDRNGVSWEHSNECPQQFHYTYGVTVASCVLTQMLYCALRLGGS
jgi:hypothetical protein